MMETFQAVWCEEVQGIQDTPDAQKPCSELGQAGNSCHDEGVHVHTSLRTENENDCLKDLSLSQHASSSKEL